MLVYSLRVSFNYYYFFMVAFLKQSMFSLVLLIISMLVPVVRNDYSCVLL